MFVIFCAIVPTKYGICSLFVGVCICETTVPTKYGNRSLFLVVVCIRDDRTKLLASVGLAPIIALMVTHSAVTPESSGRGLSHSTFFTFMYFLCNGGCAAKMPLAITQPPLQVELSS